MAAAALGFLSGSFGRAFSNEPPAPLVLRAPIQGAITPAVAELLQKVVREAQLRDAALILLELDSPGGLPSSIRKGVQALDSSEVPVAVQVGPAGAQVSGLAIALVLASHITSMREGTILESPGGSAQALKAAGVESVEGFADKREKKAQIWRDFWLAPRSASAAQALREGLVEFNSSGLTEFLRELDGRVVPLRMRGQGKVRSYRRLVLDGARVEERRLGPLAGVLQALSHPNIAALLLGAGLLLLILELARGGAGIAGVIGGAALFAALVGFQMLPLRAGALPALILGMGLPVMEIPFKRRGVFSIPGGLALGWALHFLVDRAALPSGVDLWLAIAIGVLVAVFPLVVGRFNCPARG